MSEYQYYEFQAVDRPLTRADQAELRKLSSRAQITASVFTNHYEYGDFRGSPDALMDRWFDLHLYLANWGSRRLMIRVPTRLFDGRAVERFLAGSDFVRIRPSGDNVVIKVAIDEVDDSGGQDGSGWLGALAPLRADLLGGDVRLFYLVWLMMAQFDQIEPDTAEPLPGLGPLTPALEAFAEFFDIDPDLVAAAAERPAAAVQGTLAAGAVRRAIEALDDQERIDLLVRLADGDPHVAAELRSMLRDRVATAAAAPVPPPRTAADLRERAGAIRAAREEAAEKAAAAARARKEREEERARRARLDALAKRDAGGVWAGIEEECERRNGPAYDRAVALLTDLRDLARETGTLDAFTTRLLALRERHVRKVRLADRLAALYERDMPVRGLLEDNLAA